MSCTTSGALFTGAAAAAASPLLLQPPPPPLTSSATARRAWLETHICIIQTSTSRPRFKITICYQLHTTSIAVEMIASVSLCESLRRSILNFSHFRSACAVHSHLYSFLHRLLALFHIDRSLLTWASRLIFATKKLKLCILCVCNGFRNFASFVPVSF